MIYGYIRVSTDKQDTENQKVGVLQKAKLLGLIIEKWIIDDGISGTKEPEKRLLGKMLRKIKKGDVIIVSEISRLGRKLFMIMRILEHIMKADAKLYSVKDGYELGDNIQSKVLAFAFGIAAEIERDMISKRTIEALARKKAEGMKLGRPFGSKKKNPILKKHSESIIRLHTNGASQIAIARTFKVHRHTVKKFLIEIKQKNQNIS